MTSFAYHLARRRRAIGAAIVAVAALSCGDNLRPATEPDAAVDASAAALCGNTTIDLDEDCDDGDQMGDNVCDGTCHFTCGDGVVDAAFAELCDTGISSGSGACPTVCDDGVGCTQDVLAGSGCLSTCVTAPITALVDGDGCCPGGATSLTDDDCAPMCGNSALESGEACDTAITVGTGVCPTTCDDGLNCTLDALALGGTCQAACGATPITAPANSDGCCPPGATSVTDNDCVPGCGDGDLDPGETCDTAIAVGPGSCPATCSDGLVCTRDVLANSGTCTAACTFPPITMPSSGDGCCPAGANNNNDSDCAPRCGNIIIEAGEECDDGNLTDTDACNNSCLLTAPPPTAFRLSDLDLRDPHVFINVVGCRDVTDTPLLGFSVNAEVQTNIQTDGGNPADGLLDLSIAAVFRPLRQSAATNPLQIHFPSCTAPLASTTCRRTPAAAAMIPATATNQSTGQCLAAIAGTTRPYTPAISNPSAPCFASNPVTVTIDVAGIPVRLTEARIGAAYVGSPAGNLVNGLLMGFISETVANATILPSNLPLVGGQPLSSLLPGGTNNCSPSSDLDINAGVRGWWFYMNFTAPRATWVDN